MEWLGIEYYNDKNYPLAEKYLAVLSRVENVSGVKPDFWFYLGDVAGEAEALRSGGKQLIRVICKVPPTQPEKQKRYLRLVPRRLPRTNRMMPRKSRPRS